MDFSGPTSIGCGDYSTLTFEDFHNMPINNESHESSILMWIEKLSIPPLPVLSSETIFDSTFDWHAYAAPVSETISCHSHNRFFHGQHNCPKCSCGSHCTFLNSNSRRFSCKCTCECHRCCQPHSLEYGICTSNHTHYSLRRDRDVDAASYRPTYSADLKSPDDIGFLTFEQFTQTQLPRAQLLFWRMCEAMEEFGPDGDSDSYASSIPDDSLSNFGRCAETLSVDSSAHPGLSAPDTTGYESASESIRDDDSDDLEDASPSWKHELFNRSIPATRNKKSARGTERFPARRSAHGSWVELEDYLSSWLQSRVSHSRSLDRRKKTTKIVGQGFRLKNWNTSKILNSQLYSYKSRPWLALTACT